MSPDSSVARTVNRRRELAIRKALGAGRLQMAAPALAEAFLLVGCGAALALALDAFLRRQLSDLRWPSAYGIRLIPFSKRCRIVPLCFLTAFAAFLLSSFLPTLRNAGADVSLAMKQGEPSLTLGRWNLRNSFVTLQVVLSMVLLMLCGLFLRSLLYLTSTGPGFDVAHTLIAAVHPLPGRYDEDSSWDLRQQVLRRVLAIPGVDAVTSAGILPLMGEVPDALLRRAVDPRSSLRHVYILGAGDTYCATLAIPILRGRDFQIADRRRKPVPVIVNRTLAAEFFPRPIRSGSNCCWAWTSPRFSKSSASPRTPKCVRLGKLTLPQCSCPISILNCSFASPELHRSGFGRYIMPWTQSTLPPPWMSVPSRPPPLEPSSPCA